MNVPSDWFSPAECPHPDGSIPAVGYFAHELACDLVDVHENCSGELTVLLPGMIRNLNRDAEALFRLMPSTVGVTMPANRDKTVSDYDRRISKPVTVGKWSGTSVARIVRNAAHELRSSLPSTPGQGDLEPLNGSSFSTIDPDSSVLPEHLQNWKKNCDVRTLVELRELMLIEYGDLNCGTAMILVSIKDVAKVVMLEPSSLTSRIKEWPQPLIPKRGRAMAKYVLHGLLPVLQRQFPELPLSAWDSLLSNPSSDD